MKLSDIHIRDPFILPYGGIYYMYGKKDPIKTAFCVYKSRDLIDWSEPTFIFENTPEFWGEYDYWAPEVHEYKGKFYLFASFKSDNHHRATQIFVSDIPDGKFVPVSDDAATPSDWECLDGTLYIDKKGKPHIVFCHEWAQIGDGSVCEIKLSDDLKTAVSEPKLLWHASDCSDSRDIGEGVSKVTDGPFLYRTKGGALLCIWSTFTDSGYSELISRSDNGDIDGNWSIDSAPLSAFHGGHGMIFKTFDGDAMFVMHLPNDDPLERAVLYRLIDDGDNIKLADF